MLAAVVFTLLSLATAATAQSLGYITAAGADYVGVQASFSPLFPYPPNEISGTLRAPATDYVGCGSSFDASLAGAIAVLKRGNCTFAQKALFGIGSGATAIVVINYENNAFEMTANTSTDFPPSTTFVPMMMIPVTTGNTLETAMAEAGSGGVVATLFSQPLTLNGSSIFLMLLATLTETTGNTLETAMAEAGSGGVVATLFSQPLTLNGSSIFLMLLATLTAMAGSVKLAWPFAALYRKAARSAKLQQAGRVVGRGGRATTGEEKREARKASNPKQDQLSFCADASTALIIFYFFIDDLFKIIGVVFVIIGSLGLHSVVALLGPYFPDVMQGQLDLSFSIRLLSKASRTVAVVPAEQDEAGRVDGSGSGSGSDVEVQSNSAPITSAVVVNAVDISDGHHDEARSDSASSAEHLNPSPTSAEERSALTSVQRRASRSQPTLKMGKPYQIQLFGPTTFASVLLFLPCLGVGLLWYFFRHESWAWALQDLMGISISISFISVVAAPNMKVTTVLLCLMFVYDIWFVFISPYVFGQSVMIAVATGGSTGSYAYLPPTLLPNETRTPSESIPLSLIFPRLSTIGGGYSLLGLGDIFLPGVHIAFCLRFDLFFGRGNEKLFTLRGYFLPNIIAYVVALLGANVAVILMNFGQPALLYIVPALIFTTLIKGAVCGEVKLLMKGFKAYPDQLGRSVAARYRLLRGPRPNDEEQGRDGDE
eukprot:CAMPEP_0113919120 /NCGR_PEP_ID=MMETSP0780_2-20120614/33743_1 /TAXON_ID=652834 /ORGANISM="Palpitomonas bilix" /LENGTH=711 /DNA_ID=CAMNT_0000919029 /DNA_START=263 /DNA_END=2399 /DNA_ORIENTATION=- /assembly_acc=CAM_ASM_000599